MANPKAIGNEYERLFSRQLSNWAGYVDRDVFWRESSSGAKATIRSKKSKINELQGDIVAIIPELYYFTQKFFIDTKCYKEWNPNFINSSNQKSNTILLEWMKVYEQCPDNMIPIMPVRIRDRKTDDIIIVHKNLIYNFKNQVKVQGYYEEKRFEFCYSPTLEFLKLNTLDSLYTANKEINKI
jgi:hypothetical protein